MNGYELIEHTADIGIKVYAETLEELFSNAALGMFNLICDTTKINPSETLPIYIQSTDLETLLIDFLNELIFFIFTKKMVFSKIKIDELNENKFVLKSNSYGEYYNKDRHGHLFELKSATFHNLKIERIGRLYITTIIFDV